MLQGNVYLLTHFSENRVRVCVFESVCVVSVVASRCNEGILMMHCSVL